MSCVCPVKSLAATIKALQRDHDLSDVELLIMDTQPTRKTKKWVKHQGGMRYAANTPARRPSALDQVFDLARGDVVLMVVPSDLGRPRPGVVVQGDDFAGLSTVFVCPVSSDLQDKLPLRPIIEVAAENGLRLCWNSNAAKSCRCAECCWLLPCVSRVRDAVQRPSRCSAEPGPVDAAW